MAIRPNQVYAGRVDVTDEDYPHGKARNVSQSGAGDGTPLERTWLNDLWGFQQALLGEANVTPNGEPDSASSSQYLEAVQLLTRRPAVQVSVSGTAAQDAAFTLAIDNQTHTDHYSISAGTALVPASDPDAPSVPWYVGILLATAIADTTSDPFHATIRLASAGQSADFVGARWSGSQLAQFPVSGLLLFTMTDLGFIAVINRSAVDVTMSGKLFVARLTGRAVGW